MRPDAPNLSKITRQRRTRRVVHIIRVGVVWIRIIGRVVGAGVVGVRIIGRIVDVVDVVDVVNVIRRIIDVVQIVNVIRVVGVVGRVVAVVRVVRRIVHALVGSRIVELTRVTVDRLHLFVGAIPTSGQNQQSRRANQYSRLHLNPC